jgi:hypothetical protein
MSALSLQGVLGYNVGKVLKRPHIAAYITSVNSDFFTSKDYLLRSSVGLIQNLIRQRIHQPSICGFEHSIGPLWASKFKITYRRPAHGC